MTQKVGMARYYAVIALVIALDQITKFAVEAKYAVHQFEPVTSFFNLGLTYNPGAAFSFLADHDGWQRWFFTALGVVSIIGIVWFIRTRPTQKLFCFAMACILGGAIGNVIDRVLYGYVVDMLDFHWRWLEPLFVGGHFPAFNIADSAITIGAGCLILDEILRVKREKA